MALVDVPDTCCPKRQLNQPTFDAAAITSPKWLTLVSCAQVLKKIKYLAKCRPIMQFYHLTVYHAKWHIRIVYLRPTIDSDYRLLSSQFNGVDRSA